MKRGEPTDLSSDAYFIAEVKYSGRTALKKWKGKQRNQARAIFAYAKRHTYGKTAALIVFRGGRSSDRTKLRRLASANGSNLVIISVRR